MNTANQTRRYMINIYEAGVNEAGFVDYTAAVLECARANRISVDDAFSCMLEDYTDAYPNAVVSGREIN